MSKFKKIVKVRYIGLVIGVGIISIFSSEYIKFKKDEAPKETYLNNGKWIIPLEEGDLDEISLDELIVRESKDIPRILHKMSNTMIVPADGIIDGTIEVTKATLTVVNQSAYKYYLDKYGTEESYIESYAYKVISRWMEGDFTHSVEIHNHCAQFLGIKEGEAIDLDYNDKYK